jgi:hypothetical protein
VLLAVLLAVIVLCADNKECFALLAGIVLPVTLQV